MVDVTLTRIVHVEFAGIVELLNVNVVSPLVAAIVAELPQFDNEGETGFDKTRLAGNESVRDACVSAVSRSLLRIRRINWLVCPTRIVFGEKLLLNVGGWSRSTCSVALAGVVFVTVPPFPLEDSAPSGIVLIKFPVVVDETLTETVHEPGVSPT